MLVLNRRFLVVRAPFPLVIESRDGNISAFHSITDDVTGGYKQRAANIE